MPTNHGEISQTQHVSLNLAHSLSYQCPANYSIPRRIQRKEHKAKTDYLDSYYSMIKKWQQVGVIEQ